MALVDLPLLMKNHVRGKRSPVTCALKCANQCAGPVANCSDNGYFRDIASSVLSRRTAIGGGLSAVAIALGGTQGALATDDVDPDQLVPGTSSGVSHPELAPSAPNGTPLTFYPIAPVPAEVDKLVVPEGFDWHTIIRWGDPLLADAPDFDWDNQSAEAQKLQFGYNNDYTEIQEIPGSNGLRAVMFVNQEYTNVNIMVPPDMDELEKIRITMAAQGLSVVELERDAIDQPYRYIKGAEMNRRILVDETAFEITGPAAGDDLMKTVEDPEGRTVIGTFANCAGGLTPWGTLLSGEENWHGYFVGRGEEPTPEDARYGVKNQPSSYGFEKIDERFDLNNDGYENEHHRFGYIIEVDPWNPESTPKKHTSIGRFKHEGANVIIGEDGRVVVYSGDDERFDYLYKFVSRKKYIEGDREHNMTLLEEGDLYVARFSGNSPKAEIDGTGELPSDGAFDGSGEWLPLLVDGESQIDGFTPAQIAVHTRLAADAAGATKMDRCEDVEPSLKSRRVYVACTNNSNRGVDDNAAPDEVNPRTENRDGHVVEIDEMGDQASTTFSWNLLLVAGDPASDDVTYFGGFPMDKVSPISCPDNLAFDSVGNLWISTDGAPSGIGYCDGLFRVTLDGEARGRVEQFLSVPRDAETCGPIVRDQQLTAFVSVQHPGEDGEWGAQRSFFPDYDNRGPRPTVVQVLQLPIEQPPAEEEPAPSDGGGEPVPSDGGGAPAPSDGGGQPTEDPQPTTDPKPTQDPAPSQDGSQGGNQGGNSQGGNQGGNSQGGNSQGGNSQGGNQGGNSQGGSSPRGSLARTGIPLAGAAGTAAALMAAGGALMANRRGAAAPADGDAETAEATQDADEQ